MQAYRENKEKNARITRPPNPVLTLGHGVHTMLEFVGKLKENKVGLLIDVRSRPASRYRPFFNKRNLETVLSSHGIGYLWRGQNLGGLEINVGYDQAIDELIELSKVVRVVVLCSESDPTKCHRYLTISPDLEAQGMTVEHLLWDPAKNKLKSKQARLL